MLLEYLNRKIVMRYSLELYTLKQSQSWNERIECFASAEDEDSLLYFKCYENLGCPEALLQGSPTPSP